MRSLPAAAFAFLTLTLTKMPPSSGLVAWVVVLGDFGRSPRMQYHTLSLSQKPNTSVYVIAYPGSNPLQQLVEAQNVHFVGIPEPGPWIKKLPFILGRLLKVALQVLQLLWLMLVALPRPHRILMQNPPAIPTMAMCWLAAKRHGAQLVIDWHNYGYTILGLTRGKSSLLVRICERYERFWAWRGQHHFCVTHAMKQDLQDNWGVSSAIVLHDRPPSFFQRTPLPKAHDLFMRLSPDLISPTFNDYLTLWFAAQPPAQQPSPTARDTASTSAAPVPGTTIITSADAAGGVAYRAGRPAVVVSSTSWTPDEDFSVLLQAAELYDAAAETQQQLPPVLFLITGRGPQRAQYLAQLQHMQFKHVAFRSLWLEAADYPVLLGAVDIGVSLHASSSGLDLPMKVVDMFGSGLPVCALAYACISELVSDGETGLLFSTPQQLSDQLQHLLSGFLSGPNDALRKLQQGVATKQQSLRWDNNWDTIAWPVMKTNA